MRKKIKTELLTAHPDNPRWIRSKDFDYLVESIRNFPEMLKIRPIVCNLDHVVLGGNQRLQVVRELGWKFVDVEVVDLTEDQQKEFLIKDNNSSGDWNMDMIANQFDLVQLEDWGMKLPDFAFEADELDFDPDRSETTSEDTKTCQHCGKQIDKN